MPKACDVFCCFSNDDCCQLLPAWCTYRLTMHQYQPTTSHVSLHILSLCGLADYSERFSTMQQDGKHFFSKACYITWIQFDAPSLPNERVSALDDATYSYPDAESKHVCRLASSHDFDKGSPANPVFVLDEEARRRSSAEAFASWQNSGASSHVPQSLPAHRPPWDVYNTQQSSNSQGFPCVVLQAAGYARRTRR